MKKSNSKRIQHLITKHLLECGSLELKLPDNVILEIGITQEGKHGEEIVDGYCFVKATRSGNSTLLDTYNVGLQYVDDQRKLVCFDNSIDKEGRSVKRLDIV